MVINLCCVFYGFCERRNDEHCFQFQSGCNHLLAKAGQVILVSPMNLLDQTMHPQAFEHPGDLGRQGDLSQITPQSALRGRAEPVAVYDGTGATLTRERAERTLERSS